MIVKRECRHIAPLLWDYSARGLPEIEIERIETHLQSCLTCREQVEQYRQTVGVIAAYRNHSVPPSQATWQGLRHRLEAESRPAGSAPLWGRFPSLTLGSVAVAGLMVVLMANGLGHQVLENASPAPPEITVPTNPGNPDMPGTPSKLAQIPPDGTNRATAPPAHTKEAEQTGTIRWDPPRTYRRHSHARTGAGPGKFRFTAKDEGPNASGSDEVPMNYASMVDGGQPTGIGLRDFVLSPVVDTSGQESTPQYVMGGIPIAFLQTDPAAYDEETLEARGW
jgi:hypothetical protein